MSIRDISDTSVYTAHQGPEVQPAVPLITSRSGNCSFDYLVAVAQEEATQGSFKVEESKEMTVTKEMTTAKEKTVAIKTEPIGAVKEEFPIVEYNTADKKFIDCKAQVARQDRESFMARFKNTGIQGEDYEKRGNRLRQNMIYRKLLVDNEIFPVHLDNGRVACSSCRLEFDRDIFVWRHGVKHLSSKPFSCCECSKTFVRSDSLQRHVKNFHADNAPKKQQGLARDQTAVFIRGRTSTRINKQH